MAQLPAMLLINRARHDHPRKNAMPRMSIICSILNSLFDHFATNLAFWGALTLTAHEETRPIGCVIAIALAIASSIYGYRIREGTFVIYAWVYGTVAVDIVVCGATRDEVLITLYLLVSTVIAIAGLFFSHARMRSVA